jgi:hypothetical protein
MADLEALLKRLIDHRIEFVIIGGYAAVSHGASLMTQDVDVCCRFTPKNLLRLQEALADLHPVHRMTPQKLPLALTASNCRGLKNLYLLTELGVLDCLSEVAGLGGFVAVRRASIVINPGFGKCRVLDLDALIKAKQAMDRPRDRQTLIQLRALKRRQRR